MPPRETATGGVGHFKVKQLSWVGLRLFFELEMEESGFLYLEDQAGKHSPFSIFCFQLHSIM